MIGQSCKRISNTSHQIDYFVWVRQTEPSLEVRSLIDEWLRVYNAPEMVESDLIACWGESTNDLGN